MRGTQENPHACDDLIGATESGRILNVDKTTLTRWVASGRLVVAHKLPGRNGAYLFRRGDINALAQSRQEAGL
jgi:predicted site-specific integrase-resolvase